MSEAPSFLAEETEPEIDVVEAVAEPAPEPEQKGEESAPPAEPEESRHIPISALLDEREKRQKFEREAEEYRRELAALRAPREAPPDIFTDPDQRLQFERQQMQGAIMGVKMQQSRFLAERDYSADEVKAAVEWFNDYPELSHRMLNHASPFHAAVDTYRKFKAAEKVGPDPDAWINSEVERRLNERLAAQAPAQPIARPPRSLAAAPAAGGVSTTPATSGFDMLFPR